MTIKRRKLLMALVVLGASVCMLARKPLGELLWKAADPPAPELKLAPRGKPVPGPREIAQPHLVWAQQETERVIDEHLKGLDGFFADAKKNTPAFAEDALGWKSKWNLIRDFMPFSSGGHHEKYIRERFEKYVFTPAGVEHAVKQVVESYLREVKSIEGTMLVRVKADVADFPAEYPMGTLDNEQVEKLYAVAIRDAIDAAKSDAAAVASLEVVMFVVGEVLAKVAVELGVSAGILGTGTALSLETFGIAVLVGLIVDAIVSWIWDWWQDPKGELANAINAKLDEIHRLIVDDSQNVVGLRTRLRELARERARVRETAVFSVLKAH